MLLLSLLVLYLNRFDKFRVIEDLLINLKCYGLNIKIVTV